MIVLVLVLSGLALLVSLLTAAALVEVYQRGGPSGPVDRPTPVPLGEVVGTFPSSYGLPAHLDSGSAVLLFVSPTCPACFDLAMTFGQSLPDQTHVVVAAHSAESAYEWLNGVGLPADRCTIDPEFAIIERLGLKGTPVAIVVAEGRLAHASSVPSAAWFSSLLQEVAA